SRSNILRTSEFSYPFFNMAVWVDSVGQQKVKWAVAKTTTPSNFVGDRLYFKEIKFDHLWSLSLPNPPTDGHRIEFSLERILSRNTGETPTVLSMKGPDGESVATI